MLVLLWSESEPMRVVGQEDIAPFLINPSFIPLFQTQFQVVNMIVADLVAKSREPEWIIATT